MVWRAATACNGCAEEVFVLVCNDVEIEKSDLFATGCFHSQTEVTGFQKPAQTSCESRGITYGHEKAVAFGGDDVAQPADIRPDYRQPMTQGLHRGHGQTFGG